MAIKQMFMLSKIRQAAKGLTLIEHCLMAEVLEAMKVLGEGKGSVFVWCLL